MAGGGRLGERFHPRHLYIVDNFSRARNRGLGEAALAGSHGKGDQAARYAEVEENDEGPNADLFPKVAAGTCGARFVDGMLAFHELCACRLATSDQRRSKL